MSVTNAVLSSAVIDGVRAAISRSSSYEDLASESIQKFVGPISSQSSLTCFRFRATATAHANCPPKAPKTLRSVASTCTLPLPSTFNERDEAAARFFLTSEDREAAAADVAGAAEYYWSSVIAPATGFGTAATSAVNDGTLSDVRAGLLAGHVPQLTPDGSGGTYMMRDASGDSRVAVFKPMDEEPLAWNCPRGMPPSETGEGLKRGTRVGEGAYREVAAFLLDHPLRDGDSEGFAGVPPTAMVRCDSSVIPVPAGSPVTPLDGFDVGKVGSLQQFVSAVSNCEDMGPSSFPACEVHKIAILDMRLANTDRNGANILVQEQQQLPASSSNSSSGSSLRLVPIDHGYCLPETWEDCTFEWLYWPQAKKPFSAEALEYIQRLDGEADLALLQQSGWVLRAECALVLLASTLLLKKGAAAGKTAYEIGSLMVRNDDPDVPSLIEAMVAEAKAKAEGGEANVMQLLSESLDKCFQ